MEEDGNFNALCLAMGAALLLCLAALYFVVWLAVQ